MAYKILYKTSVSRDLKRLSKAEIGRILNQIDRVLSKKADSNPVLKGQFAGLKKYRIGDYRVIYSILGDDILILRIGHRRDVYKKKIS
ncbi:MAG: type II toxin-antitoxin system RelE/ParE family toxin [Thermoguttaceae bacterium]